MSRTLTPFSEFQALAATYYGDNPAQRWGQALFNTLFAVHPEVAEKVRSDFRVDPFYDDDRVPAFLEFVERHLEEGTT